MSGNTVVDAPSLGVAFAARRRRLGLTQDDVAFAAGVNRRVVGEIERGKATAQLGIVLRVAEAVGLVLNLQERA